jgi:hypothetical protein
MKIKWMRRQRIQGIDVRRKSKLRQENDQEIK